MSAMCGHNNDHLAPIMTPSPLIGRVEQMARLGRSLDRQGDIALWTVAVYGEPGVGKSRLLHEFARTAKRAGVRVLGGRAAEYEQQMPFGVLDNAFDDYLRGVAPHRLVEQGAERLSLLSTAFPSVRARYPAGHGAGEELIDVERYRLYRAVRETLEAVASAEPTGLVVILDDLHWADEGSIELLDHLLRHPPHARLTLVLALRPRQTSMRLLNAIALAVDKDAAETIEVPALSPQEAGRFLEVWQLPESKREELYAASGGNPLYLDALARIDAARHAGSHPEVGSGSHEYLPTSMHAALFAEFSALPPDRLVVASAAALAGDTFDPELVAAICATDHNEVPTALDDLAGRDLIRPVTSGFCYRHPLLRTVAYQAAGAAWRIAAHRRADAVLRERRAPATTRAHHVERYATHGDTAAIEALVDAGVETMATAPASTVHWLSAALKLLPDDETSSATRLNLLAMLAQALGVSGHLRESREVLHEVRRLLPAELTEERVHVVAFCAMIERLLGRKAEAKALLISELDGLPDQPTAAAVILRVELAATRLMLGDHDTQRDWAAEAYEVACRLDDRPLLAVSLSICVSSRIQAGEVTSMTFASLDQASSLTDALPDGDLCKHLEATFWLSLSEMYLERWGDAQRHAARGLRLARASGQNHLVTYLRMGQGTTYGRLGYLTEATECFDDALEAALLTASDELRTMALAQQSWIAAWRGQLPVALSLAEAAVECAGREADWCAAVAQAMVAQAKLYAGDPAACVDLLLQAGAGPDLPDLDILSRPAWYQLLAEADAARGDITSAMMWADRAEAMAAGWNLPVRTGFAHLAMAHASVEKDPATAVRYGLSAAGLFARAGARVDAGRSYLVTAVALGATGDVKHARENFARARSLFTECGAGLFHAQAVRAERRMNSRRPRRSRTARPQGPSDLDIGDPAALTVRELEVARMVMAGLTNRQIAERLFVSPKTVEAHLHRIFARLGASSRAAVAVILANYGHLKAEPGSTS